MRKLVYSLILAVMMCGAAFGASSAELERMSKFISYFTELRYFNINIDTISNKELIHFAAWYNDVFHYGTRSKECSDEYCSYGSRIIDKKYIAEAVRKFLDLKLKHTSTEDEYFDGKYYHSHGKADGDPVILAEVQEVSRSGNILILRGELYGSENEEYRPGTFTARVKPHRFNGQHTWSLLSLESSMREEL